MAKRMMDRLLMKSIKISAIQYCFSIKDINLLRFNSGDHAYNTICSRTAFLKIGLKKSLIMTFLMLSEYACTEVIQHSM